MGFTTVYTLLLCGAGFCIWMSATATVADRSVFAGCLAMPVATAFAALYRALFEQGHGMTHKAKVDKIW